MNINNQFLDLTTLNKYIIGNAKNISDWFINMEPFVDLTVTSPPYWDTKDYEGNIEQIGFKQSYEDYKEDIKAIFEGVYNISKDSANLVLIVDTLKKDGRIIRLPDDMARILESIGWIHQDTIIWDKVKTLPWSRKGQMRNVFEYILIFSKTNQYIYNMDEIRIVEDLKEWWIGYPERYNPQGKVPENIWSFLIPTQGSWGTKQEFGDEEFKHACPFPPELMARIIKLLSNKNDVVFDPFCGTGVLFAVAEKLGRRFWGLDVNESYHNVFESVTIPLVDSMWEDIERYYIIQNKLKELLKINITKLRILKYPYALMKKQKSITSFKLAVILTENYTEKDTINEYTVGKARYTLFLESDSSLNEIHNECQKLLSKAPFTKYGIIAHYQTRCFSDIFNSTNEFPFPLYLYSGSDFSTYHIKIDTHQELLQILNDGKLLLSLKDKNVCPVITNVKITKTDYKMLPAEEYTKNGYREKYSQTMLDELNAILDDFNII